MRIATAQKEHPIIFSGEMVRAILEGRKTQTRRIVKPQPPTWLSNGRKPWNIESNLWGFSQGSEVKACLSENTLRCSYGTVGDRLWVRETFCCLIDEGRFAYDDEGNPKYLYAADGVEVRAVDDDGFTRYRKNGWEASPWTSPMRMPRDASRITLEITDVRVQRVQEISHEDAEAEGCYQTLGDWVAPGVLMTSACGVRAIDMPCHRTAKRAFECLWDSINAKRAPWASNPWVWAITFRRINP